VHRPQGLAQGFKRVVDVAFQAQQVARCFDLNALGQITAGDSVHHGVNVSDHVVQGLQSNGGLLEALTELSTAVVEINLVIELATQQSLRQAIEACHRPLNRVQRIVDGHFHQCQVTLQITFNASAEVTIGKVLNDLSDLTDGRLLGLQ